MKKLIAEKKILIILFTIFISVLSTILLIDRNNNLSSEISDNKIDRVDISFSVYIEKDNILEEDNIINNEIIIKEEKLKEPIEDIFNNKEEIVKEEKENESIINNNVSKSDTVNSDDNQDIKNDDNTNTQVDTSVDVDDNSSIDDSASIIEDIPVLEDNSVRVNDIFYRIHKGRIDYTDLNICQNETLEFYLKYIRNINNLNYIEVMSNSDKILGYFVEYVFKEASYDNYEDCSNVGNSIKSSLNDRVTSYQCTERDNNYYLKIFTDYD